MKTTICLALLVAWCIPLSAGAVPGEGRVDPGLRKHMPKSKLGARLAPVRIENTRDHLTVRRFAVHKGKVVLKALSTQDKHTGRQEHLRWSQLSRKNKTIDVAHRTWITRGGHALQTVFHNGKVVQQDRSPRRYRKMSPLKSRLAQLWASPATKGTAGAGGGVLAAVAHQYLTRVNFDPGWFKALVGGAMGTFATLRYALGGQKIETTTEE